MSTRITPAFIGLIVSVLWLACESKDEGVAPAEVEGNIIPSLTAKPQSSWVVTSVSRK